jgi:hypothetical protein
MTLERQVMPLDIMNTDDTVSCPAVSLAESEFQGDGPESDSDDVIYLGTKPRGCSTGGVTSTASTCFQQRQPAERRDLASGEQAKWPSAQPDSSQTTKMAHPRTKYRPQKQAASRVMRKGKPVPTVANVGLPKRSAGRGKQGVRGPSKHSKVARRSRSEMPNSGKGGIGRPKDTNIDISTVLGEV